MGEERLEPGGRIGRDGPGQPDPGPSGGAGERPQDADAPFLRLPDLFSARPGRLPGPGGVPVGPQPQGESKHPDLRVFSGRPHRGEPGLLCRGLPVPARLLSSPLQGALLRLRLPPPRGVRHPDPQTRDPDVALLPVGGRDPQRRLMEIFFAIASPSP